MGSRPQIVGARATGPSHLQAGKGCDDAFAWISFGQHYQVLAVADGAGSVTGTSAWGSWAATQFVTSEAVAWSLLHELYSATNKSQVDGRLRLLFHGALGHVRYFGRALSLSPESMNTTLCVAVLAPGHAYVAQIGDGIVATLDGKEAKTVLVEAKGESAATDTHFLQLLGREPGHPQWRWDDLGNVPAIALSTDGLRYQATSIKDNYAAYPGFFEALWQILASGDLSPDQLETWLKERATVHDPPGDDKSLLLALRAPIDTLPPPGQRVPVFRYSSLMPASPPPKRGKEGPRTVSRRPPKSPAGVAVTPRPKAPGRDPATMVFDVGSDGQPQHVGAMPGPPPRGAPSGRQRNLPPAAKRPWWLRLPGWGWRRHPKPSPKEGQSHRPGDTGRPT